MKLKSILALILAVFLCLAFAGCSSSEKAEDAATETTVETTQLPQTGEVESELTAQEQLIFAQDGVFNLLMLGVDNFNDIGTSDTIMLLSVDRTHGKLKFTSFARDIYVTVPGYGVNKLSVAYSLGGASLLVSTIEHNFDIDIERYALLNYYTFEDIVNILGSVELELTEKDVEHINSILRSEGDSGLVTAKSGKIKLDGKQALAYIRTRGGDDNVEYDIHRTKRQRSFLMEVAQDLSATSASQLLQLAKDVMPFVNTDITNDELNALLKGIRTYLTYSPSGIAIPFDDNGSYAHTNQGTVIEINDWGKTRTELKNFIYEN